MSKLRARALCAAVLIGLLSLSACGDDGESDASAPTDDRTTAGSGSSDGGDGCTPDRVGGSITVGEYSPTLGLDPIDGGGSGLSSGRVGGIPGAAIYDTLLILDEETGEFIPHVAESIKSSDDRTRAGTTRSARRPTRRAVSRCADLAQGHRAFAGRSMARRSAGGQASRLHRACRFASRQPTATSRFHCHRSYQRP